MRAFHHGIDRHRELLSAIIALVHAGTMLLALKLCDVVHAAAMRADWTIRSADCFQLFAGLIFSEGGKFGEVHLFGS